MATPIRIDLTGLKCPLPLLRTKKKLGELSAGQLLEVTATDPHSREDFLRYCDGSYCSVLAIDQGPIGMVLLIRREAGST